MNRDPARPDKVDRQLLDLLVDGELDAARRRDLISQLAAAPGGWQQCALAFLEAQAWRVDLRDAAQEPASARVRSGGAVSPRRPFVRRLRNSCLVALGIACAFAAGWLLHPAPATPLTADAIAPAPRGNIQTPVVATQSDDEAPAKKAHDIEEPADVRIAGIVTFKFNDHGEEREMHLPVLEGPGIDIQKWLERPPAIRASAVQALERRGHKVETHRQLLTLNLKDGRKLLLPLDQVDVRFAHRVYQ